MLPSTPTLECRDDVVRVAHDHEPGMTIEQIAKDFRDSPDGSVMWLRQANVDEDVKPGVSGGDSAEPREAWKRIKLWERQHEVLRRAAAFRRGHLSGKAPLPRDRGCRRQDFSAGETTTERTTWKTSPA
jgi:transposase